MDCILSNVFYLGWAGFYSYSYSYFLFFHAIHRYVLSSYFTIHRFSLYLFALSSVIPLSLLLISSPCAVRPRLWREQRRVMFGLSVWLLVSVSGAAGSSDSAGGAAGPSRVQPSPCDTLSVTDPLRLVTRHPLLLPCPRLCSPLHYSTTPPAASGLFTATLQSVAQSVTNCLTEDSLVGVDLHVFWKLILRSLNWYDSLGFHLQPPLQGGRIIRRLSQFIMSRLCKTSPEDGNQYLKHKLLFFYPHAICLAFRPDIDR